ncbi:MAG: bifunctional DNA-formamidopyrimidine glycosylase/DNA-(apurinic or apyrimidinic site) lyase [Bdellovibrionales bacterium]
MPELPEVENVRLGLAQMGLVGQTIEKMVWGGQKLRRPIKMSDLGKIAGQTVVQLERRAKFLIWQTADFGILSHLGMTGSWRAFRRSDELLKHDHIQIYFLSGLQLTYHDPRRFGLFEIMPKAKLATHPWLTNLGPEPLSENFSGEYLFKRGRRRDAPIKNWLMDQKQVVGIGNIYASEALYRAKVRPARPVGRVKKVEADAIAQAVREVLQEAIAAGGSTIRDYRNAGGEAGAFQKTFAVYDRAEKPCTACATSIRMRTFSGRSTYWCPKCQV